MNALYRTLGITKQAFHKRLDHYLHCIDEQQQLLRVIHEIRRDHPKLSARQMYFVIKPNWMGRDKFESFCYENGLKIERRIRFRRTTNSWGVTRFPNRIIDFELTGKNQVWVSDITYYQINEKYYYLTFIMDLFSRYIVGYSASENLLTECTTLPALKMAVNSRTINCGLILHSDGGGQYYSKQFLNLTRQYQIINSMGETVFENATAERINGTIKNDYLIPYGPTCFGELERYLTKAVRNYNVRPHMAHRRVSPADFETIKNVEI